MPKAAARAPATIHRIAVAAGPSATPEDRRAAATLATRLCLPFLDPATADAQLLIAREDGRFALHEPATRTRLAVDYTPEERRRYSRAGGDLLVRAVGRRTQRVVDATAGLGRDAIHLAWMGRRVVAIERDPVVAALLSDALDRAVRSGALEPGAIELLMGEGVRALRALRPRPEVVYLDPMFPAKRRSSALARKEMRLLRLLVGQGEDADDAEELFEAAREAATERVVVKRPDRAPPLVPHPTVSYAGKLVRYDVYRTATAP